MGFFNPLRRHLYKTEHNPYSNWKKELKTYFYCAFNVTKIGGRKRSVQFQSIVYFEKRNKTLSFRVLEYVNKWGFGKFNCLLPMCIHNRWNWAQNASRLWILFYPLISKKWIQSLIYTDQDSARRMLHTTKQIPLRSLVSQPILILLIMFSSL